MFFHPSFLTHSTTCTECMGRTRRFAVRWDGHDIDFEEDNYHPCVARASGCDAKPYAPAQTKTAPPTRLTMVNIRHFILVPLSSWLLASKLGKWIASGKLAGGPGMNWEDAKLRRQLGIEQRMDFNLVVRLPNPPRRTHHSSLILPDYSSFTFLKSRYISALILAIPTNGF